MSDFETDFLFNPSDSNLGGLSPPIGTVDDLLLDLNSPNQTFNEDATGFDFIPPALEPQSAVKANPSFRVTFTTQPKPQPVLNGVRVTESQMKRQRLEDRKQRNRESASRSRNRQKQRLSTLQLQVGQMTEQLRQKEMEVVELRTENRILRQQLGSFENIMRSQFTRSPSPGSSYSSGTSNSNSPILSAASLSPSATRAGGFALFAVAFIFVFCIDPQSVFGAQDPNDVPGKVVSSSDGGESNNPSMFARLVLSNELKVGLIAIMLILSYVFGKSMLQRKRNMEMPQVMRDTQKDKSTPKPTRKGEKST